MSASVAEKGFRPSLARRALRSLSSVTSRFDRLRRCSIADVCFALTRAVTGANSAAPHAMAARYGSAVKNASTWSALEAVLFIPPLTRFVRSLRCSITRSCSLPWPGLPAVLTEINQRWSISPPSSSCLYSQGKLVCRFASCDTWVAMILEYTWRSAAASSTWSCSRLPMYAGRSPLPGFRMSRRWLSTAPTHRRYWTQTAAVPDRAATRSR